MASWTHILADLPAGTTDTTVPITAWYDIGFWNYVLVIVALIAVYYLLRYRVTVAKFIGEVKVELDKCSWPWDPNQTGFKKYKELRDSTVVVILSVILLAGFVTSSDWVLTHLVGFLTGTAILK
jgi:preprotein translocase subunit SecE